MSRVVASRRWRVRATRAVGPVAVGLAVLSGCAGTAGAPAVRPAPTSAPVPSAVPVVSAAAAQGWGQPTWADEFDGVAPAASWSLYDSEGNGGNGLRRPSQVSVAGGVLTQSGTADATSAGMLLAGRDARYGRWEVRARADQDAAGSGAGGHPYHVVVALIPTGVPYNRGERDLDFAEGDIGEQRMHVFVHHPPFQQDYADVALDVGDWHTYGVEVTPDHVTWFVDGVARMTDRDPAALPATPMALNVQLDANSPDGMTPGRLQLDWARYYPLPAGPPPAAPSAPAPETGDYGPGGT